ncbi:MAG: PBP1A family penicillin-binding protein [Patescibacteria group bacterium]
MSQTIRKITIQQNGKSFGRKPNLISRLFRAVSGIIGKIFLREPGRGRGGQPNWFKKIISWLPYIIGGLLLAGIIGGLVIYAWVLKDLPNPNKLNDRSVAQTTKIYDRTGENILFEVYGDQKRTIVELDKISPHVINATIVAEDRNFYSHKGFKITSVIRAFIENLKSGHRGQGGSTITQQLVKITFLSQEKTYIRKFKELLLAIAIERQYNKEEILKMYLNEIPYGSVVYGIESAAEYFLGKTAAELTLSEAALLASLPQSTTYYSPYGVNLDDLTKRQHWILDSMFELGYVTFDEAEDAKLDDVLSRLVERNDELFAPHFIFYVREQLADQFGELMVEQGGLKIITTVDFELQAAAEKIISEQQDKMAAFEATNAALLSLDPNNGDILAMVGSADYGNDEIQGKYNSLLGLRQPGSSIKPLVYATAFEKGYTPNTVLYDVLTTFGGTYNPQNYDFGERGPVTVREALAGSLNIPAVKMLYLAGLDNVITKAGELGYSTLNDRDRFGLTLALGGGEVRPIEHISSFAAFANDGELVSTRAILRVEDSKGNVLLDRTADEPNAKRVLNEQSARQLTSVLSDNAARAYVFGENSYLQLGGRPVAAKSGTTNSYKDAWTIGYTPSLVTGVWVGNSSGKEMKYGADGSQVAAPIWNAYMRTALTDQPWENFIAPEPIETGKPVLDGNKETQVVLKIDSVSGLLATEHTPEDLVVEKGFGIPHSILFFLDKSNPLGPPPENPADDPMFEAWENGVATWVSKQENLEIETDPPPTESDNVHTPENKPRISIRQPLNGANINSRDLSIELDAFAQRGIAKVELSIGGDIIATIENAPFTSLNVPLPNRFPKGFHTITMTVYDDVKNRASADVTINLVADAGPIGTQWLSPINSQTVYRYQFPFNIRFRITDNSSVERLEISAQSISSGTEEVVGTIDNPPLPNMSTQWSEAPEPGNYRLRLIVTLKGGERKIEEIMIVIR